MRIKRKIMIEIDKWKIVKSKSNQHPKYGHPFGEVLCRSLEDANNLIKKSEFKDLYITEYSNK